MGLGGDAAAGKAGDLVESVHDGNKVKGIILEYGLLGIALSIDRAVGPAKTILHQVGTVDEGQEEGQGVIPQLGEDSGDVPDATDVVGQPLGHGNHLRAGIDTHDGLGVGEGPLEGTGGDAHSATQVAYAGSVALGRAKDVVGQLAGDHGPDVLALVGGIVDGTGGEGSDEGVEAAEEARVAKDVDAVVEPIVVVVIIGGEIRRIVDDVDGRARLRLREGLLDDVLVPLLGLGVDLEGISGGHGVAAAGKGGCGQDDELGGGGGGRGEFHGSQ
mmetsp:Transcript_31038/g.90792  ORF Transcript_31038/g.90792 Transcript_31038/m.90792 type:complete len:273 (-) Transcript_31038:69-887(-)